MRYQGTDIDGPRLEPEGLMVRGYDLAELMGTRSFLECFFLALYDRLPSERQQSQLELFLDAGFRSIGRTDLLFRIIPEIASSPDLSINALIAGLAIDRRQEIAAIPAPDFDDLEVTDVIRDGLYFMSILPIILGLAALFPRLKDTSVLSDRLEKAKEMNGDHLDRIVLLFRGRPFANEQEKEILNAVLSAFCAGFGYLTPSIMAPRISIGSGVSVALAIIAGCTTAGCWHLGTSQDVIIMFRQLLEDSHNKTIKQAVEEYLAGKLEKGEKLLGFGHPFFKRDPRVLRLKEIIDKAGYHHEVIGLFQEVCTAVEMKKQLYPNLETMHGAISLSMGFDIPFLGPSLALIGRSGGMLAHIHERLDRPKFGVRSDVARNFFDKVPMDWL